MKQKHIIGAVVVYMGALTLLLNLNAQVPPINFNPISPLVPEGGESAVALPAPAAETTISLIPQERNNVVVARVLSLTVTVDAAQLINAVGATITFPKEYLTVVKLSKDGSMLNLWSEEPVFSNETGTITFSGISTAGGVKGKQIALTVVFKSNKAGSASVNFADAQILAHDGLGTDITGNKIGVTYTISEKPAPPSADINGDGKVGIADLSIVVFYLGKTGTAAAAKYDLSGDGKVDLADLSILVSRMVVGGGKKPTLR